jgi:predicted phage gp36 major capsid-like protein
MCAKNLSNAEMTKIKVVDIHELNNFGIYHFLCWNQFGSQILVRTYHFLKFQILSNDKMTKIKVVDINELNNFGIHHFLCWNHFGSQRLVRTCHFLKFQVWKV